MQEAIALNLGPKSYSSLLLISKLASSCALSDTLFGNLIRYHHAVDTGILNDLATLLEENGNTKPLAVNEVAVLQIIAACDIVRKMFACDAFDVVTKDCQVTLWEKDVINNLIDFANFLINDLIRQGTFKKQIEKLLVQLEEKIQPV